MPNNVKLFGKNSFNLMIMSMILLAILNYHIIMSVRCIRLFSCYLFVSFGIVRAPVDQGVEVQPQYLDEPYYLPHQQGKRKSTS